MKILVYFFLLLQFDLYSQTSINFEVIPKIVFANQNGNGIVPSGFVMKKNNPGLSFGFTIDKAITDRIHVNLGTYYHINNYYSKYYRDFDHKVPFNTSLFRSSYFEPKLTISYNEISFFKLNNLYFEAGISYLYTRFPEIIHTTTLSSENSYGNIDTVKFTTYTSPLTNSRFRILFGIGKTILLGESNFILGIGLNAKIAKPEQLIEKVISDGGNYYQFDYNLNSSYIGVNVRVSYKMTKKKN